MLQILLYPFMVAAFVGFCVSLAAHLATLLGWELPPQVFGLHMGIFIVWIPAALASSATQRHSWRSRSLLDQLSGCPRWMRVTVYVLFAYGLLNFVGNLFWGANSVVNDFAVGWMLFYWIAFATLYGVLHRPQAARCLAGHTVSSGDRFCPKCGQPVAE